MHESNVDPHAEIERVRQVERMVDLSALALLTVIVSVMAESFLVGGLAPQTPTEKVVVYLAAFAVPVCSASLLVILCRRAYNAYRRSKP